MIDLSNNSISGEIPSSLWNLSKLVVLRLSQFGWIHTSKFRTVQTVDQAELVC
jgi:hypothetical protein